MTRTLVIAQKDRLKYPERNVVFIGRGGDGGFGNPFPLTREVDRAEVIARFREYFHDRIERDPEYRERVKALRGKILACPGNCKPSRACHGDVYVEWLENEGTMKKSVVPKPKPTVLKPTATLTAESAENDANARTSEALQVVDVVKGTEITTAESYAVAVDMVSEIKTQRNAVESARRSFVDPLNEVVKRINGFFRPALDRYDECERILKSKLVEWTQNAERERQRLLEEAESQAQDGDLGAANVAIEEAEALVVPKVAGFSQSETWTGEVVDASKIPREYLIPDEVKLRAVTKAHKGDPKIPGWKAYPKTIASVRSGS